jgi:hypothetical protein
MNRIEAAIARTRPKVEALDDFKRTALDKGCAISFSEHAAYQDAQAQAHASGIITPAEATIMYVALGEIGSTSNGGWSAGTDTTTKIVVTQIVGELLERRITRRAKVGVA